MPAFLFLVLAACLFVLSRGLNRGRWRLRDAFAGALVGAVGGVAGPAPPARRTLGGGGALVGLAHLGPRARLRLHLQLAAELPEAPRPGQERPGDEDHVGLPVVLEGQRARQLHRHRLGHHRRPSPAVDGRARQRRLRLPGPRRRSHVGRQDGHRGLLSRKSISTNYLFIGGDPQSISLDQEIAPRVERHALPAGEHRHSALERRLLGDGGHPRTRSPSAWSGWAATIPTSRRLPDAAVHPYRRPRGHATKTQPGAPAFPRTRPASEDWLGLYSLNERIVRDATDPYQITLRIEQYLRQFYSYSLTPPASDYSSPYAAFLFDTRSGYCQHFAGAMALLLRYNGIPSRVAVGFASGEESEKASTW